MIHTIRKHDATCVLALMTALMLSLPVLAFVPLPTLAEEESREGEEHEEGHIELSAEQIEHANITLATAGPGTLVETLKVYGSVKTNPEYSQHVSARFEGQIKSINKSVGDSVKRGETLLTIEANDSLQRYTLVASIDGVVTQRQANAGEQTDGRTLLQVDNLSSVWVELSLFPKDLAAVSVGQKVRVRDKEGALLAEGATSYISPIAQTESRSVTARVPLDNQQKKLIPGSFVIGQIILSEDPVPLLIDGQAIQIIEDRSVVFVKGREGFEPRAVELGRSDGTSVEVLGGLEGGETYVAANSFVLKSELGKEDAEHGH